jgi:hypothetical protein
MTRLQTNTLDVVLWSWMLLLGLGIGPSMSGFTVVVQNSAPIRQLGAATSTLTFLRQIGGSVGLAISGTIFSQSFTQKLPEQLVAHGVPHQLVARFQGGSSGGGKLTGVNLAAQLRQTLPPPLRPLVPKIVAGIHDAFSLAIGQVFWLTVGAGVLAFVAVLLIPEVPLRGLGTLSGEAAAAITGSEVPVDGAPVGPVAAR